MAYAGRGNRDLAVSIILSALCLPPVVAFIREDCQATISQLLTDNPQFSSSYPQYFFGPDGANTTSPIITLQGCRALCDDSLPKRWYPDVGQRYMAFLLPLVTLLFNMDVSPLDKAKYFEMLHLLGNPIGSIEAMLSKLKLWDCCARLDTSELGILKFAEDRTRVIGTVLAGIEDVLGPGWDALKALKALMAECLMSSSPLGLDQIDVLKEGHSRGQALEAVLRQAAHEIADARTNDILRTWGGLLFYLLSVIAAFVTAVGGGNNSPPAGRIATALLLSWLIPSILLSNYVGGFVSRRAPFRIVKRMVAAIDRISDKSRRGSVARTEGELRRLRKLLRNPQLLFQAQRWNGGSDLYRPDPVTAFDPRPRKWALRALATTPILISFTFGFPMLWEQPPYGLNCRSVFSVCITGAWIISACLSWTAWYWSTRFKKEDAGRAYWIMTLGKDAVIGIVCLGLIFLSSAGLFNTCECWSFELWYGDQAHVPLNVTSQFENLDNTTYTYLSSACLAAQVLSFIVMYISLRKGVKLLRWSERAKMAELGQHMPEIGEH